jgi:hypothetical protein
MNSSQIRGGGCPLLPIALTKLETLKKRQAAFNDNML